MHGKWITPRMKQKDSSFGKHEKVRSVHLDDLHRTISPKMGLCHGRRCRKCYDGSLKSPRSIRFRSRMSSTQAMAISIPLSSLTNATQTSVSGWSMLTWRFSLYVPRSVAQSQASTASVLRRWTICPSFSVLPIYR